MFIEKNSRSKMLNVIRIPNAVGSIKTHGFGILNSTVSEMNPFIKRASNVVGKLCISGTGEEVQGVLAFSLRRAH